MTQRAKLTLGMQLQVHMTCYLNHFSAKMYEIENVLAKNEFFRPTFGAMILFLDQMNSNKGRFLIVTGHMVAS